MMQVKGADGTLEYKMSKSLGNFVAIDDILKRGDPDTLRIMVLNSSYRNRLTYSENLFEEAGRSLKRLKSVFAPTENWGTGRLQR